MKRSFYKLISMMLSLIVLLSSVSFTVESHYCGDHLMDVSLFSQVEGCGMDMVKESTEVPVFTKKSCCRNEVSFVEGLRTEQQPIQKTVLSQVYFATAFVLSYQNLFTDYVSDIPFDLYRPPLVDEDITILFENFRI